MRLPAAPLDGEAYTGGVNFHWKGSGLDVIITFSSSTQLSMRFFLLINVKMPTIVGILTLISRNNSSQNLL